MAASIMEDKTMKEHVGLVCTLAMLAGSLPNLFAQGSHPSQPIDPTAQAPATQAPATPPTFPTSKGTAQRDRRDVRVYVGAIVKDGDAYVLKAANEKYLLDNQKKAKNYEGKDVKITGTLDKDKNLIHVKDIKASPSM
jgi:hypothetical protein